MKLLIVLAAFVGVCASSDVIPIVPGDNSHYVEGVSRYIWMPDGDGKPHLVDLEEPVNEVLLSSRNGANNAYWLYTKKNPNNAQILVHGNANSVTNSNYASNKPLIVVAHGAGGHGNSIVNSMIRSAYLDVQDCNVIVVDWSALASSDYTTAVKGVPDVGRAVGNFVQWLFNTAGGNWNNVHFVGHSLGAHVVGNAGRAVGGRVRRVTGLDPAGPLWIGNENALNKNSGVYVESIITDGGVLGIMDPIAHANFYPNGGRNPQPGCLFHFCSHDRSIEYFASSVRSDRFTGRQCVNIQQAENNQCTGAVLNMGNANINKNGNGLYGLRTDNKWPY